MTSYHTTQKLVGTQDIIKYYKTYVESKKVNVLLPRLISSNTDEEFTGWAKFNYTVEYPSGDKYRVTDQVEFIHGKIQKHTTQLQGSR